MTFDNYKEAPTDSFVIKVKADDYVTRDFYSDSVVFKEGASVRLRSNPGFYMTVDSFQVKEQCGVATVKAECVWLDKEDRLCRELFNLTSLVLHDKDVIENNK